MASTPTPNPTPTPAKPPQKTGTPVTAGIGQTVWFYGDHAHAKGMKSIDDGAPFAAIVASVPNDRLVNVLVIDHNGTTFPLMGVPMYQGDDKDDKKAVCHCSFDAPEPKKTFALTGTASQPIALGLSSNIALAEGATLAGVKLVFIVPPANTYTFMSEKGGLSQVFTASPKPQVLAPTTVQVTAGALEDLAITVADEGDVLLAVTATELAADGVIGKTYSFNENITIGSTEATSTSAASPGAIATPVPPASTTFGPPPLTSPTPAPMQG